MAPEGVIVGGWSYVVAAYVVTAIGLSLYTWSLRRRLRATQEPASEEKSSEKNSDG